MELAQDFKDLLTLLEKYNVDYMIVGGYALAFHGAPRYTGDIDIFVKSDIVNSTKLLSALHDFGFISLGLTQDDFCIPDQVIQLGLPPVRIDILTSISGIDYETAKSHSINTKYGTTSVCFISRDDYLINKRASGRNKDLADIDALTGDSRQK